MAITDPNQVQASSPRIMGIGIGLFILIVLWSSSLILYFITRRALKLSIIGPLSITLVLIITSVLLFLPRNGSSSNSGSLNMVKSIKRGSGSLSGQSDKGRTFDTNIFPSLSSDWMYVWRFLILFINLTCLLVASSIVYLQWISKRITRQKPSTALANARVLKLD